MKKNYLEKINDAFYGISLSKNKWPSHEDSKLVRESSPPGYLVKTVLMIALKTKLHSGGDKSEWAIPIFFKDVLFLIEDYKRDIWNIFGPLIKKDIAEQLRNKIISACKILNKEISQASKNEYNKDNFVLKNSYKKASYLYQYFSEILETALDKEKEKFNTKDFPNGFVNKLNYTHSYNQIIESLLIATTVFFFSFTEVIFDSCFSLGDRKGIDYKSFRKLTWEERFKFLIPINENLKNVYHKLVFLRKYYRNIPIHSSPEYFYKFDGIGFIPSDFNNLSNPNNLWPIQFDVKEANNALVLFEQFDKYLRNAEITKYGYRYASSGLPILIKKTEAEKLKLSMTSIEEFEIEIQARIDYQCAYENMEI
jgi:hypothetical protein